MIKKNLKTMILTTIIILVPMVFGLLMWDKLPAEMATHFGENGEANGWSSKSFAIIGIPLIMVALHWFCAFFTGVDPKKGNISDKMMLGCMFLVIGNYMPKMKQNYSLGLKVPWTLNSEENWNRTHRLGGYVFMIGGVLVLVAGFMQMFWLVFVVIVLTTAVPTVYSYSLYKKGV